MDASPAHKPPEPLVWPAFFTPGDKASATKHLAGLEREIQQTVLDEIDWMQQGNKVRSPVALARALCHQARNDLLVPDGAHRIRDARERARAVTAAATGFAGPAGAGQVKALPAATRPQGATAQRINRLLGRMA